MRFSGTNVIVTGASRGIGHAIAAGLIAEGANVALMARTKGPLDELVAEARGRGLRALAIPTDVSNREQVGAAIEAVRREFKVIHGLVNSAGTLDNEGIADHSFAVWDSAFAVNVHSYFCTTRAVIGDMFARREGHIVNIISTSGKVAIGPNRAAYVATKHALMGFTREVAVEAAPYNVYVNGICPGFVLTDMVEDSMRKFARDFGKSVEETRQMYVDKIPLKRFIDPKEVVPIALFLLSKDASGIVGQTISVDGGYAPL
jgi:NAD(P)-dependent dehydrogenase (short-subunit alcohol dehydrogenase family)